MFPLGQYLKGCLYGKQAAAAPEVELPVPDGVMVLRDPIPVVMDTSTEQQSRFFATQTPLEQTALRQSSAMLKITA